MEPDRRVEEGTAPKAKRLRRASDGRTARGARRSPGHREGVGRPEAARGVEFETLVPGSLLDHTPAAADSKAKPPGDGGGDMPSSLSPRVVPEERRAESPGRARSTRSRRCSIQTPPRESQTPSLDVMAARTRSVVSEACRRLPDARGGRQQQLRRPLQMALRV